MVGQILDALVYIITTGMQIYEIATMPLIDMFIAVLGSVAVALLIMWVCSFAIYTHRKRDKK